MAMFSKALIGTGMAVSLALLSGCALNMQVPIKDPVVSKIAYSKVTQLPPVKLTFKDVQTDEQKAKLLTGTIPMTMMYQDKPFESASWIATQTVNEMVARGLPVTLASTGDSATNVVIKHVHMENHRASGFSPFVTFTTLRADVDTPSGPQRLTAYVKRGKVPVWSFNEVIDPTFNDPLAILTKELAAKLNQQLFKQIVSDSEVDALIATINKDATTNADAYLDVYQLGFSNNPRAIPELVKLSSHANEYVRLAALSSLGILKATDQTSFLMSRYEATSSIWQDRAMALKAIGDLGTPESRAYLQKQQSKFASESSKEATWTKEIIALYL